MNYKLSDKISWRNIQGQILILDPRINQKAHELNPVASYIWSAIDSGSDTDTIISELKTIYSDQASAQQIELDAKKLLTELEDLKLIIQ